MDTITGLAKDERAARVALSVLVEPGDPLTGRLVNSVGAVETVRLLTSEGPVPAMSEDAAALGRKRLPLESSLEGTRFARQASETQGIGVLLPNDEGFPASLHDLGDRTPYVLWVKGVASLVACDVEERFTVTGARAATSYGVHVAESLAADLAAQEKVLVSGGAYGVDAAVHSAALAAGGHTIAVMAGGLDRPYPMGNRDLLERIGDLGLLVSELPPGATPTRGRFIARARITAALSGSTTIVEAASRSGSLLVARQAHGLGRVIGAVPGPVTSIASIGTHQLLQERVADLITDAADLVALLDRSLAPSAARSSGRASVAAAATRQPSTRGALVRDL